MASSHAIAIKSKQQQQQQARMACGGFDYANYKRQSEDRFVAKENALFMMMSLQKHH